MKPPVISAPSRSCSIAASAPTARRKTSYRFRDGVPPLAELCFVAEDEDGELVGAVRYWPVMAGRQPALLLGPLAIAPARQARGIGRALVFHSLEIAGSRRASTGVPRRRPGLLRPIRLCCRARRDRHARRVAGPAQLSPARPYRPPCRRSAKLATAPSQAEERARRTEAAPRRRAAGQGDCDDIADPLNESCRGVAQPGSASALGAEGRVFESPRPDQPAIRRSRLDHQSVGGPGGRSQSLGRWSPVGSLTRPR